MALKNSLLDNADDQEHVGRDFFCWKVKALKSAVLLCKITQEKDLRVEQSITLPQLMLLCEKKGQKVIHGLLLCSDV